MKSSLFSLLISFAFTSSLFSQSESDYNFRHGFDFEKKNRNQFVTSLEKWILKNETLSLRKDGFRTNLNWNENNITKTLPGISLSGLSTPGDKTKISESTLPIAIGAWTFFYLLNPIFLFENDKIAGGITKEVSLGFGYFGEHRLSFEYSYLFRADLNSHIRLGYQYDILLKKGLKPSNLLQGTSVLSLGGGYFTDFTNHGYFPEASFGYSIRNDKFLFYPSLKLRFTYVAQGSNIVDFSFGIIIGIANPFIDMKIRKNKNE